MNIALILMICLAAWLPLPAFAGEGNVRSEMEAQLIGYINQARQAPLETARAFGLDPQQILSRFSDHEEMLLKGLPLLTLHPMLQAAAQAHADDMIDRGYFSRLSREGWDLEDRLLSKGYIPTASGESLGMVGFQNLLSPDAAVRIIFEGMLKDELDASRSGDFRILNPEVRDIGVGIAAGRVTVNGMAQNRYIAVCDIAASRLLAAEVVEDALWQMINDARSNPLKAVVSALGKDEWSQQEDAYQWMYQIPPLARNAFLDESARSHARDMIRRVFFNRITPEGAGILEQAASLDYHAVDANRLIGAHVSENYVNPLSVMREILSQWVREEFSAEEDLQVLFGSNWTEIGIGYEVMILDLKEKGFAVGYVVVADIAAPRENRNFVVGTVYRDANGNSAYDLGEGVGGKSIVVDIPGEEKDGSWIIETDIWGGYQWQAGFGPFLVKMKDPAEKRHLGDTELLFLFTDQNVWSSIAVPY